MIKDVNILLSVINTALRDKYSSFEDYLEDSELSKDEILEIMGNNGYYYDRDKNAFKKK